MAGRETVVLALTRWQPHRLPWGLMQLVRGALPHSRPAGLRFERFLGSGQGGGFGITPGLDRFGYLGLFASETEANQFIEESPQLQSYRQQAAEMRILSLQAFSSRGAWSGNDLAVATDPPSEGERIASITRASIRLRKARAFWSRSPAAEEDLAAAPGCQFAVGLGEAPLVRQATFSIWESQAAMTNYAHCGGHRAAIEAAYGDGYFSEWAFIRFRILRDMGHLSSLAAPA